MKLGNIAGGDSFFGRVREQADFWRYIENDHILLSGPRRLGKSSLINRLREDAEASGLLARMIDVQDCDSAAGFIAKLNTELSEEGVAHHLKMAGAKLGEWSQRFKISVDLSFVKVDVEPQGVTLPSWQVIGNKLQHRLAKTPALLLIDEFSVFLQRLIIKDRQEAEALVAWLCAWRKRPGVATRFLFTGSICLASLLETHQLYTYFNDCYGMELGAFSPKDAQDMLILFAGRKEWELRPITAKDLCSQVGWLSPFMLNKLLDEAMNVAEDRLIENPQLLVRVLEANDVAGGYERLLNKRSIFIHWEKRLERDLQEPELAFTKAILNLLAKNQAGLTATQLKARLAKREPDADKRSQLLQQALIVLADDGYISKPDAKQQLLFLSFPLRDWWSRNHV